MVGVRVGSSPNLSGGAEVFVRLDGVPRSGRAEVLDVGTPTFQAALKDYLRRFPVVAAADSSAVLVTLAPAGATQPMPAPITADGGVLTATDHVTRQRQETGDTW